MKLIKDTFATSALVAAFALLSAPVSVAHAALSQYNIGTTVDKVSTPIAGFTPQASDVLQGSFSYLSADTALGSASKVIEGRYATRYVYELPADARIDFTFGGHTFASSKVSLVVSKSAWLEAGPDMVGVIGQDLTMDGVALAAGLVGFEFVYPVGTFGDGQPPRTLQLNAPIPTGTGFAWKGTGYIAQNGGVGLSTALVGGGSASVSFNLQSLSVAVVPEPATWAMMLLGLGGLGVASVRRRVA